MDLFLLHRVLALNDDRRLIIRHTVRLRSAFGSNGWPLCRTGNGPAGHQLITCRGRLAVVPMELKDG